MSQPLFGSIEPEPASFGKIKRGVEKTRAGFVARLDDVLAGSKQIDEDLLEELEASLLGADLGVRTTTEILVKTLLSVRCFFIVPTRNGF